MAAKEVAEFDEYCRDFIARSPFVLIASTDGQGSIDNSPKGDPPGFVQVLDQTTLAIPDRPVPGTKNILRVRGTATIY